jgi:hypothetical protein
MEAWMRTNEFGISCWDHTKMAGDVGRGNYVYVGVCKPIRDTLPDNAPAGFVGKLVKKRRLTEAEVWTSNKLGSEKKYVARHYIREMYPISNRELKAILKGIKVSQGAISYLGIAA